MTDAEKLLKYLTATHTGSELPMLFGTEEQQENLLQRLGEWQGLKQGRIQGMVYDDMLSYYLSEAPGRVITGRDLDDETPVGLVAHPAPLDITSWTYAFPLVVQAGELTYQAFKPAQVSDEFMNEISIAGAMTKADLIERYQNSPLARHLFPDPQKFRIDYYHTRDGEEPELISYLEANQPCPISEWPRGSFAYCEDGINHASSGALVSELFRTYDPTIRRETDEGTE